MFSSIVIAGLYIFSNPVKVAFTIYLPFDTFSKTNDPLGDDIDPFTRLESGKLNNKTLAFATVLSDLSTIIPWMRDCANMLEVNSRWIRSK